MKKYLFIAGILISFFAITFNAPAEIVIVDNDQVIMVDDSTKTVESKSEAKATTKKGCCSQAKKGGCSKAEMKKCGELKTATKECPDKGVKSDPEKK